MKLTAFPIKMKDEYIEKNYVGGWRELEIGLDKEWITYEAALSIAKKLLREKHGSLSRKEEEIFFLNKYNNDNIRNLIKEIVEDSAEDQEESSKNWAYMFLKWLYENKSQYEDLSPIIEYIYTESGYMEEIAPMVSYMPVETLTAFPKPDENYDKWRLNYWENYLKNFKKNQNKF